MHPGVAGSYATTGDNPHSSDFCSLLSQAPFARTLELARRPLRPATEVFPSHRAICLPGPCWYSGPYFLVLGGVSITIIHTGVTLGIHTEYSPHFQDDNRIYEMRIRRIAGRSLRILPFGMTTWIQFTSRDASPRR
jgi:hypothetical protein